MLYKLWGLLSSYLHALNASVSRLLHASLVPGCLYDPAVLSTFESYGYHIWNEACWTSYADKAYFKCSIPCYQLIF